MAAIFHALTLDQIVLTIVHALQHAGVSHLNADRGSGGHRAWIETAHWIITVRAR
jgi:hypothetical protein